MQLSLTIIFITIPSLALCTFDMNLSEMQFVADHLTEQECKALIEGLSLTKLILDEELKGGKDVPNVSCIRNLLAWDRTDGRGQSFNELAYRLDQIGRSDLADKLGQTVYKEKAEGVMQSLIKPFSGRKNKNSTLLRFKTVAMDEKQGLLDDWSGLSVLQVLCILSGIATVTGLIFVHIYYRYPQIDMCLENTKDELRVYLCGAPPKKMSSMSELDPIVVTGPV